MRVRRRLWFRSTTGDSRNTSWQRRRLWTRPTTGATGVSRNVCTRTPLALTVRARWAAMAPVAARTHNRRSQRDVHHDTFSRQSKCAVGEALRGWLPPSLELAPTSGEEPRGAVRVDPALQGRDLAYLIASSVPRLNPLACLLVSILIRSPTLKARQRNQQKNSNSPASETVDARILAPPRSSALVTRIKNFFS